jgi:hypothetical protein
VSAMRAVILTSARLDKATSRVSAAAGLVRYSRICWRSPAAAFHSVGQQLDLKALRLSSATALLAIGRGNKFSFMHDGQVTGTLIVGSSMDLA